MFYTIFHWGINNKNCFPVWIHLKTGNQYPFLEKVNIEILKSSIKAGFRILIYFPDYKILDDITTSAFVCQYTTNDHALRCFINMRRVYFETRCYKQGCKKSVPPVPGSNQLQWVIVEWGGPFSKWSLTLPIAEVPETNFLCSSAFNIIRYSNHISLPWIPSVNDYLPSYTLTLFDYYIYSGYFVNKINLVFTWLVKFFPSRRILKKYLILH